ncbi:MAG: hypothetical protein H7X70_03005 [Candidatus Kapabacteria bacterium]|nr:hypothetical protein [Candidatus Kapabacteria bacterium]
MKKQNTWMALAITTFAALALGLSACSEAGVTPGEPMGLTEANTATTFDLNAYPMEINDPTMETMMSERPDPNVGRPARNPFSDLLRHLNLTAEQKVTVDRLLASHSDCVKAALENLRAAEKAIVQAARAAAEAVKQQVKDGTLTREEAREQLRAISKRTHEALRNLPGREEARAAIKACDESFIRGLSEILTEDQLAILKRWLASRNHGGTTPPNPRGDKDTTRGGKDTTRGTGRG